MSKPVIMELPPWLIDPSLPQPTLTEKQHQRLLGINAEPSRNYADMVELAEQIYEAFFEHVVIELSNGMPLKSIVKDDPRGIDTGKFRAWVYRDKDRLKRYKEARLIGAGAIEDEMIDIADATNNPLEDVSRSKLRIDTRKDLLKVWDRDTYGEHKRVEVTSHTEYDVDHLEQVQQRLRSMMKTAVIGYTNDDVVDVEPTPLTTSPVTPNIWEA